MGKQHHPSDGMTTCVRCGQTLPASEFYLLKNPVCPCGRRHTCRRCSLQPPKSAESKVCEVCGAVFRTRWRPARFCSLSCASRVSLGFSSRNTPGVPRRSVGEDGRLTCTRCGKRKPVSEFYNASDVLCGKDAWCKSCNREVARTPENKARQKLEAAVRSGRIQRQPCVVCGATPTDAHHADYSKPFDVVWLCRKHHSHVHHGRIAVGSESQPFLPARGGEGRA